RAHRRLVHSYVKPPDASSVKSLVYVQRTAESTKNDATVSVFFSYSHKDGRYRQKIDDLLALLKRQGLISNWYDHKITAGKDLDQEIARHLDRAQIILLLVSSNFIASDYCFCTELEREFRGHHTQFPASVPMNYVWCARNSCPRNSGSAAANSVGVSSSRTRIQGSSRSGVRTGWWVMSRFRSGCRVIRVEPSNGGVVGHPSPGAGGWHFVVKYSEHKLNIQCHLCHLSVTYAI